MRCQLRWRCTSTGVLPFGAQVVRTLGVREKPLSSSKTIHARFRAAPFLAPASPLSPRLQCAVRRVPPLFGLASADSSLAGEGCARRGLDDRPCPWCAQSLRPRAAASTARSSTRWPALQQGLLHAPKLDL